LGDTGPDDDRPAPEQQTGLSSRPLAGVLTVLIRATVVLWLLALVWLAILMARASARADVEHQRTHDRAMLWNVGCALLLWRDDAGGAYPDSLSDLIGEPGEAYIDYPQVLVSWSDPEPQSLPDGTPCSYVYVGGLPDAPPEGIIVLYTRKGILPGGRNVFYSQRDAAWHREVELTGPSGLLAKSYAGLVEALGDELTEERKAGLRAFYEVEEDGQAPQEVEPGAAEGHG
jgi:hypothetical protein